MSPEDAAKEIESELRRFRWFLSTGVGRTKDGETVFVYVKTRKHPELRKLEDGWRGYNVLVRTVGSIRPVTSTLHAQ
jgi:hypothetical protein